MPIIKYSFIAGESIIPFNINYLSHIPSIVRTNIITRYNDIIIRKTVRDSTFYTLKRTTMYIKQTHNKNYSGFDIFIIKAFSI